MGMTEQSELGPHIRYSPDKGGSGGPSRKEERIKGPDGEEWAKWLVEDVGELEDIISDDLKIEIRLLARRPDSMVGPEVLGETYNRIDQLLREGKSKDEEVVLWQGRITERHRKLTQAEAPTVSTEEILQQFQENLGLLPQAFAERMGAMAPERVLEAYRKAEENIVPFIIGPGQEPSFFVLYRDEVELEYQRKLWEARSVLVQAAAYKLNATSIEGREGQPGLINNDKMAIELNKIRLETLFRLPGVLPGISVYTEIISGEEFLTDPSSKPGDKLPGPLRSTLLGEKSDIESLGLSKKETGALLKEQAKLKKSCPKRIWEAKQDSFLELRKSIRFWLKIKGRHLLFRNKQEKQSFIKSGRDIEQIVVDRARDGEQIAWNFIFTSGLIESFNSRGENIRDDPLGPSNFMTLYLWMLLHPQERLENKTMKTKKLWKEDSPDEKKELDKILYLPKEEWSAFGTWIINNIRKGNWRMKGTKGADGKERVEIPKIFTKNELIKDALRQGGGPNKKVLFDFPKKWGEILLLKQGHEIISDAETLTRKLISGDPETPEGKRWGKFTDAPFINYRFDWFRWANTVFSVFKKGESRDVSLQNLAEAVRMLELKRQDRENLLIAWVGVNPNSTSRKPKPAMGKVDFAIYKQELKRLHPTYFVENPEIVEKSKDKEA